MPLARARGGASQEGLVSLLGAERMRSHFVIAVAMGPALRAGDEARIRHLASMLLTVARCEQQSSSLASELERFTGEDGIK